MRKIKLTIEYDGTDFLGFQRQTKGRTVQAELESALKRLLQSNVKVTAAGRTDSGVHALGQVVHFTMNSQLGLRNIVLGLNRYLPDDVSVMRVEEASSHFHAQRSAQSKVYEYQVWNSSERSALQRRWSFQVPKKLDLNQMKKAAGILCGRHDFRAFEASGGRRKSAVRRIRRFQVRRKGRLIVFCVESNGFLYKMVRSMVGTILEVGKGRMDVSDVKKMLRSKDRNGIGPTVPGRGLVLKQVIYE